MSAQKPEAGVDADPYIANCIDRILLAPMALRNRYQVVQDIAKAITLADDGSSEAAHQYLVKLVRFAEAGGYAS